MDNLPYLEIYLTSASFFLIIVYHIQLIHQIRTRPLTTALGVTNHLRGHWVESIMEQNRDLLAVQTLRNWVMTSSFLASTAILISLGLVSMAASPERMAGNSPSLTGLGGGHRGLWLLKLMV